MKKEILFLINLRFYNFLSNDLLTKIKKQRNLRVVAILDDFFIDNIPEHLKGEIEKTYHLSADKKDGFLHEFNYDDLEGIVSKELKGDDYSTVNFFCSDEFNLINTNKLRKKFSGKDNSCKDISLFRDKVKMKQKLLNCGVRVPRFITLSKVDIDNGSISYDLLLSSLGNEFIIKPIDSCGSHGVYHIRSKDEYLAFFDDLNQYYCDFEAEEFISGTLYHVDSVTRNGEVQFCAVNRYSVPNFELTQGKVLGSIPLSSEHALYKKLEVFSKNALKILGSDNMVNHMEIFDNGKELVFLEVSGRPPGALVNKVHSLNHGVNLMDIDFLSQLSISPDINVEKITNAFWAFFPLSNGKISSIKEPEIESDYELNWNVSSGEEINASSDIVSIAGSIIVTSNNFERLNEDFNYISNFKALEMA
ncbi:ATP-grasp domain-containing protein [Photobacterium leiognathi]|uniref:ATP-grasp domain-containing protein n=1 Tax=Photobacterium leiognathi TaxID=553611 RepID=UPI0027398B33|nr:ATP-grasp domain-containing protein [Photobacterium leiognathi]